MILLSLHPSPASETSAFNKIRAFSSRCAGLFPFRIKASNRARSPELSRTTYLFTAFSRVAIVPSVARTTTQANHQILSNWLKRATSLVVAMLASAPAAAASCPRGQLLRARLHLCVGADKGRTKAFVH